MSVNKEILLGNVGSIRIYRAEMGLEAEWKGIKNG